MLVRQSAWIGHRVSGLILEMPTSTAASLALTPVNPTEPLSPPGSDSLTVRLHPGSLLQEDHWEQRASEHIVTTVVTSELSLYLWLVKELFYLLNLWPIFSWNVLLTKVIDILVLLANCCWTFSSISLTLIVDQFYRPRTKDDRKVLLPSVCVSTRGGGGGYLPSTPSSPWPGQGTLPSSVPTLPPSLARTGYIPFPLFLPPSLPGQDRDIFRSLPSSTLSPHCTGQNGCVSRVVYLLRSRKRTFLF